MVDNSKNQRSSQIIGSSDQAIQLMKMIELCAPSDASILVLGESGCGKELVTRELHRRSDRSNAKLIGINCAAIPAQLLESEVFGHKKGAFSGAISDRKGRFQVAHRGTLFLDEIGDMPLELQAKLLRALEERAVIPVGSTESIPIDVRIIAATHQNLESMIQKGEFREDLYHRLNVIPIKIPPIRERRLDIAELCIHFATLYSKDRKIQFSEDSLALLSKYDWPGNVREIANLVKRLGVLAPPGLIDVYQLPAEFLPAGLIELRNRSTIKTNRPKPEPGISPEYETDQESVGQDLAMPHEPVSATISGVERIIRLSQTMTSIPDEGVAAKTLLHDIESNLIRVALEQSDGNVSKAAKLLNLGRTTLIQKLGKK